MSRRGALAAAALLLAGACDAGPTTPPIEETLTIERHTFVVGETHGCALSGGKAYCWGLGANGQTGSPNGGVNPVSGDLAFASITTGAIHTCALQSTGVAYCWGYNGWGQLGNGGTATARAPVAVAGGHRFVSLSAGPFHTCGVTPEGEAYCWGLGAAGALGTGDQEIHDRPTRVAGSQKWLSVSAGLDHTCALTTAGVPYCWGAQTLGLLGNGLDSGLRDTPSPVSGGLVLASIDAGMNVTCGRTASHATYCWGTNTDGELGQGTVGGYSAIPRLLAGRTFAALSVGGNVCGVDQAGAALCWGRNESGQLGSDTGKASVGTPTPVSGGLSFASVESGTDGYTCGATAAGRVYCWGLIYGGPWEGVSTPQLLANGPVVDL